MRDVVYAVSLVVICLVPTGEFFNTTMGTASRLAGFVLGGVWLVAVYWSGTLRKVSFFHWAVGAFVVWNALSVFWSIDAESSMVRFYAYLRMLLLCVIVWDLYIRAERIRAGLQAFVLGAYLPVVSTITNFATQNAYSWERYSSSGNNANSTAIITAIAMPFAWYLASAPATSRWARALKVANFAFVPAAVLAIALTGTRFAIVMSLPTMIFVSTTLVRLKLATKISVLVFLVISLFYVGSVVPEASTARLGTVYEEAASGDFNGRLQFWKEGIRVWTDHPLLGVGANTFTLAVPSGRSAHNSFIAILTELGLTGLALFGIIIGIVVLGVCRQPAAETYFWLTVVAVWLLGNLPMDFVHSRTTWVLLGLAVASTGSASPRPPIH